MSGKCQLQQHSFFRPPSFLLFHKIRLGQKSDSLGREAHLIYYINSVESSNVLINPLTTTEHRCPKEELQGVEQTAVVSCNRGTSKTNLFHRQVSLSNEVQTKV